MNSPISLIRKSKGRFFGLTTKDGRTFNAQLRGETPKFVRVWDRNNDRQVTIAKTNLGNVTLSS